MEAQNTLSEVTNDAIKEKQDVQQIDKEFSSSKNDIKMNEEIKQSTEEKKEAPALGTVTITLTYGDRAENHPGMQQIGKLSDKGFSIKDLEEAKIKFESKGCECELIDLNEGLNGTGKSGEKASLLIVRKAIDFLDKDLSADKLFDEQIKLSWDTKIKIQGKVVDKPSRSNLCYGEESQEPDYEKGKGTIIAYKSIPCTSLVRDLLGEYLGEKGENLFCEGNLYYDVSKCGVPFHGDQERRKVVGVRLGAELPLHYQWFYDKEPIGERIKLNLEHGDLYVMSEKAVGFDCKTKKITTLKHAAGCEKYLTINEKKRSKTRW